MQTGIGIDNLLRFGDFQLNSSQIKYMNVFFFLILESNRISDIGDW